MKFKISFTGREIGAIGIFYPISFLLECEKEEIMEKVYEKYEHISKFSAVEVE